MRRWPAASTDTGIGRQHVARPSVPLAGRARARTARGSSGRSRASGGAGAVRRRPRGRARRRGSRPSLRGARTAPRSPPRRRETGRGWTRRPGSRQPSRRGIASHGSEPAVDLRHGLRASGRSPAHPLRAEMVMVAQKVSMLRCKSRSSGRLRSLTSQSTQPIEGVGRLRNRRGMHRLG